MHCENSNRSIGKGCCIQYIQAQEKGLAKQIHPRTLIGCLGKHKLEPEWH